MDSKLKIIPKAIFLIIAIGLLVYFNSFFNGFVGDDELQITNNPAIHNITNIPKFFLESTFYTGNITSGGLYYKPLLSTFFAILYAIFGPNPLYFHIFQFLLHATNSILIFLIFGFFFNPVISFFLALIFLVHPINSETVSYISALQDALFFFFGSMALYLEMRLHDSKVKIIWVSIFLLLSVFSKETGLLFIPTVFLYSLLIKKKNVLEVFISSIVVISIYAFFRIGLAHILFNTSNVVIMQVSLFTRWLSIPSVVLYYFKNAFFPIDHAIIQTGLMAPQNITMLFVELVILCGIFSIFGYVGYSLHKKNKEYFLAYCFFVSIFFIGLLFHSQLFFPLDFITADRWFYFPFIGLLGVIGLLLQISKGKLYYISAIVLIVLSVMTIFRNFLFHDNLILLSHDAKLEPESSLISGDLGVVLMQKNHYSKALPYLLKAEKLNPTNPTVWDQLATYYYLTGQDKKSDNAYQKAILYGADFSAYQNYAVFLFLYDTPVKAEEFIKKSLKKFPNNGVIWQVYTLTEIELGHNDVALNNAKKAFLYSPNTITDTLNRRLSKNLPLTINIIMSGNHRIFKLCPPNCTRAQIEDTTFSNQAMHIEFQYPKNLFLTKINSQTISLSTDANNNALFLYSLPGPYAGVLPFQAPGAASSIPIPVKGFNAQQNTYSDGTVVLILQHDPQLIVIKIPQNSTSMDQAITDVINSIHILP